MAVCDNSRIKRGKIYRGEAYRGDTASKKRFFYGLKVHLVVTASGQPVDFTFAPGAADDLSGLKQLPLDLPEDIDLYGAKAYTDYDYEDTLKAVAKIEWTAARRSNGKRAHPGSIGFCVTSFASGLKRRSARLPTIWLDTFTQSRRGASS